MRAENPGAARWRRSKYSGGSGGNNCVEVADGLGAIVPVRDSKNPDAPGLVFGAPAWSVFVESVRAGEFPGL